MLEIDKSCLVLIDLQGKLAQSMYEKDSLFGNVAILVKAAELLEIPILWLQQCPEALGPTIADVVELLGERQPLNKTSFSCCGHEPFNRRLLELGRDQVLLCGIEAHVCVYQTAVELLRKGYDVTVVTDAVSSRTLQNKQLAIEQMRAEGIKIGSTEMVLFELLRTADHPRFKQVARLVR